MENLIPPPQQEHQVLFKAEDFAVNIYIGEDALSQISNEKLIEEWHRLYESCSWATVYQSIDFVSNWYRVYQGEYMPILILAVENGLLKGVLALCLEGKKEISGAGLNQAEYQTWISSESQSNRFIQEALMMVRKRWAGHRIQLKYLPQKTPLNWVNATPFGRKSSLLQSIKHPIMNINREWLEKELRKKNRREKINRLKRLGELKLERIINYTDFEAVFEELSTQNDFRKGAAYNAIHFENENLSKEFLLSLFKDGLLHATILKVDSEIIASNVGTMDKKWLHLQGMNAHSPRYARHSPGILHFLMMGQLLADEGFEVFDLTPGSDGYKDTLATDFIEAHHLYVADPFSIFLRKNTLSLRHHLRSVLLKMGVDVRTQKEIKKRIEILSDKLKIMRKGGVPSLRHLVTSGIGDKNFSQWYKIDINENTDKSLNFVLNKDYLPDLLKFQSKGTLLTQWEFLEDAMKRLENGQQSYSVTDGAKLLLVVWEESGGLKTASDKSSLSGDGTIRLTNLYYHPLGKGLVKEFLEEVVKKVKQKNAGKPSHAFINVNSKAAAAVMQKSGFIHVQS